MYLQEAINRVVDLDPDREIPGWPDVAGYTGVDLTYRLSVTKGSWRIRN